MPLKITQGRKTRDPRRTIRNDLRLPRLDWANLTNREVANLLGRPINCISALRRKFAPHTLRFRNSERWDTVDWSLRDCEIARMMGVSKQLVNVTRKRKGLNK